jgi:hypothetical protein
MLQASYANTRGEEFEIYAGRLHPDAVLLCTVDSGVYAPGTSEPDRENAMLAFEMNYQWRYPGPEPQPGTLACVLQAVYDPFCERYFANFSPQVLTDRTGGDDQGKTFLTCVNKFFYVRHRPEQKDRDYQDAHRVQAFVCSLLDCRPDLVMRLVGVPGWADAQRRVQR